MPVSKSYQAVDIVLTADVISQEELVGKIEDLLEGVPRSFEAAYTMLRSIWTDHRYVHRKYYPGLWLKEVFNDGSLPTYVYDHRVFWDPHNMGGGIFLHWGKLGFHYRKGWAVAAGGCGIEATIRQREISIYYYRPHKSLQIEVSSASARVTHSEPRSLISPRFVNEVLFILWFARWLFGLF
jgi:hypothetical protein